MNAVDMLFMTYGSTMAGIGCCLLSGAYLLLILTSIFFAMLGK